MFLGHGYYASNFTDWGVEASRFLFVNPHELQCQDLRRRYPNAIVVEEDPLELKERLAEFIPEPASAIIGSLPIRRPDGDWLLTTAHKILQPGCPLVLVGFDDDPLLSDSQNVREAVQLTDLAYASIGAKGDNLFARLWVYRPRTKGTKKFDHPTLERVGSYDEPLQSEEGIKHAKLPPRLTEEFASQVAANLKGRSPEDQQAFLNAVAIDLGLNATFTHASNALKLRKPPKKAPELWLDRDKRKGENPAEFIMRVYGRWMGRGLTQAIINQLDHSLYLAFHKWLKDKEPLPDGFDLPTKEAWNERLYQDQRLFSQLNEREKGLVLQAIGTRLTRQYR
ncbi:MAG: phosphatidylethanolamine/phosphatidyl-N-methylethanolamine N-methyltransferase [Hyphomicrobiales bacterium]|nr:phosphatidylethanolamine/phosphatidyl-N-methylethanolamine N-methyltransferase [Hyphomicrobiales bacterium]